MNPDDRKPAGEPDRLPGAPWSNPHLEGSAGRVRGPDGVERPATGVGTGTPPPDSGFADHPDDSLYRANDPGDEHGPMSVSESVQPGAEVGPDRPDLRPDPGRP